MTPFRYDGCNYQVEHSGLNYQVEHSGLNYQVEHSGLNVFNHSRADFAVDDGVYDPVRILRVDHFLWDLK